jgi:hypothetical protein
MDAMPNMPLFGSRLDGRGRSGAPPTFPYVGRLGAAEVGCGRGEGDKPPCPFEMFVRAGLPLAECVVVSERAHQEFMEQSGLGENLRARISRGGGGEGSLGPAALLDVRLGHLSTLIEGELNRQICETLIGLGAPSVAVVPGRSNQRYLKSIPEVKDAIREAWLHLEGLRRQMEAASRGEAMPTWSVYVLVEGGPPV